MTSFYFSLFFILYNTAPGEKNQVLKYPKIHHLIFRPGGGTRCVLRVASCEVKEL
jgi:hypothetical protein